MLNVSSHLRQFHGKTLYCFTRRCLYIDFSFDITLNMKTHTFMLEWKQNNWPQYQREHTKVTRKKTVDIIKGLLVLFLCSKPDFWLNSLLLYITHYCFKHKNVMFCLEIILWLRISHLCSHYVLYHIWQYFFSIEDKVAARVLFMTVIQSYTSHSWLWITCYFTSLLYATLY